MCDRFYDQILGLLQLSAGNGQDARSTPDADSTGLILGWAVPTNALCKLDYLCDALPTVILSAENRQARRIFGWAVLTKALCKLDYLCDALPTVILSAENRQARRIFGWAVLTKALCKLDYLCDALPTLLLS
ncbi:MAG: hypothetical protein F6J90_30525 [Moorea sp. SIOASIH]|uniref:hypothetical protein n=1 Tax=Moorena sp. SIOASIH TaxID=2607817 RepID=UPI0013B61CF6|nr:hypothetical protein [Moorena sp. SIOASIH]NEO40443.1 hypothetical protein [Moorena sp. SIOASIH]